MSSFRSHQQDITQPLEDANKDILLEYPPVNPVVGINQAIATNKSLTKEYLNAPVRITREVAIEGGWTAATITYVTLFVNCSSTPFTHPFDLHASAGALYSGATSTRRLPAVLTNPPDTALAQSSLAAGKLL